MKKLCVFGIGGIGTNWAEEVYAKMPSNLPVTYISIDTDQFDIIDANCTHNVDISYPNKMEDALTLLSENGINLFDEQDISKLGYMLTLPMNKGANAWRLKAFATFVAYMCIPENKERFDDVLNKTFIDCQDNTSIYILTSLAGGTGSALSIPISLYVKKFLKEKGIIDVDVTLFAICPDMFCETMNLEMRTKSYANAYATLSEINLINNTILNKEKTTLQIGFENDKSFGLLFDANKNQYLIKEYIPFNNVLLFDRMVGVSSIDFHINVFANYVCNYYLGFKDETLQKIKDSAVFKSYNIIELEYSVDSVVDYIAKYKVNQTIKNELLDFYKKIEKFQPLFSSSEVTDADSFEVETFANKLNEFFEYSEVDSDEKASYVLNRYNLDSELLPSVDDISWLDKYILNLSNDLYLLIKNQDYDCFYSKINDVEFTKSKEKNHDDFLYKVDELYFELTETYFKLIKNAINLDENSLFLSSEDTNVFSLVNNLLKDDDKYIHPTLALIRLSKLYENLKNKVRKKYFYKNKNILYDKKQEEIPEEFLSIINFERGRKGYGSLGEDRFKRVIAKIKKPVNENNLSRREKANYLKELNLYKIDNANYDKKFILKDFNLVLENIISEIKNIYLIKLLEVVKNLIISYRKTLKDLSIYSYKIDNQVEDSKKEKFSKFVYYGIATSTKNRDLAVEEYNSSIKSGQVVDEDDLLGKIIYDYNANSLINDTCEDEQNVDCVVNTFIDGIINLIKNSDYFEKINDKNIFEKLFEQNGDKKEINHFKLSMKMESNLLTERNNKIVNKKTLYLSPEIAQFILNEKVKFNIKSNNLQDAIDEFLINIGEYNTHVILTDIVSSKKALITIEKSNINLNDISKINGEKSCAIYKNAYNKSLLNIKKFDSIMWNPNVFKNT